MARERERRVTAASASLMPRMVTGPERGTLTLSHDPFRPAWGAGTVDYRHRDGGLECTAVSPDLGAATGVGQARSRADRVQRRRVGARSRVRHGATDGARRRTGAARV